MHGCMDVCIDVKSNAWIAAWMNRWKDKSMDDGCIDAFNSECVDGKIHGYMDRGMDG